MVISVLPLLGANPALRPQWDHRLATLDQPDADRPWTPYANLQPQNVTGHAPTRSRGRGLRSSR
jgi:hypothetical protein